MASGSTEEPDLRLSSCRCRSGCAVQPDIRGISSWRQVQQKNLTYACRNNEGAGSDAHEDGGGGEGEAHEGAPTPDQKDPAFFKQAAQVEVAAKKGVE